MSESSCFAAETSTLGSCQVKKIKKIQEKNWFNQIKRAHPLSILLFGIIYRNNTYKQNQSLGLSHPPTSEFLLEFFLFFQLDKTPVEHVRVLIYLSSKVNYPITETLAQHAICHDILYSLWQNQIEMTSIVQNIRALKRTAKNYSPHGKSHNQPY